MRTITLKILGLFMTVFAVSGVCHVEKAHAATPEMEGRKSSSFTSNVHGGGCGCVSCMQSMQKSTQDYPA